MLMPLTELLPPLPPVGQMKRIAGFVGAGEALAVAECAARENRPLLFLAHDSISAAHLAEELPFFAPQIPVRLLPDWGCLPYDSISPSPEVSGARLAVLAALHEGVPGITVAAISTMLLPCPPPAFVAAGAFDLRLGATVDLARLTAQLAENGYARVPRVLAAGEFAIYGGQMDIFPPDAQTPFRLVMMDNEIEQIRLFDPQTQRSIGKTDAVHAMPSGECDLSSAGISRFRQNFTAHFGGIKDSVYDKVSRGDPAVGMEFMLPLFFERPHFALDYPPPTVAILWHRAGRDAAARFLHQARRRQKLASVYENRAVLPAKDLFMSEENLHTALRRFSLLELGAPGKRLSEPPVVAVNHRRANSHAPLANFLRSAPGRTLIAVDSEGRRQSLAAALAAEKLSPRCVDSFAAADDGASLAIAPLRSGFVDEQKKLTILTEAEIFQVRLPPRAIRRQASSFIHAGELAAGQTVAHRDYGIGRYTGLECRERDGKTEEYLAITYADEQRLWLPVSQLHLLAPHHGGEDTPLSKLGSGGWKKIRARAEKNARDTAARLLDINARRLAQGGKARCFDERALAQFAGGFHYEETPDQEKAMQDILSDLRAAKPMDRLITADVGFGKTEAALRAAYACALAGAQAAILAPTTLLAEQHARVFADRFAGFPARTASLTRFASSREKRAMLQELADGKIDIIIGTHALLSSSVKFHNLGLLVIDEEHRFGVRQKEHFKSLRADVDILSLSATPIPRTLAMALEGARDISIIATPPPARLAVKTTVAPFSRGMIVDACERELLRGGQIYFVHNEVRTLESMAAQLREWLPEAKLSVAHGSMRGMAMEQEMRRFLRHETNLLLCTTIVESGLDIASANTIIINRADRLGLSRLHQLRGRVGRGAVQAFALFLTPPEGAATPAGEKRLSALAQYAALGSGFFIAMRDLEIRGAGEILGERQSGDIEAVGCAMYQRMLKAAMRRLHGDATTVSDIDTIIDLHAPALLPADYVGSANERLGYYRRLSLCEAAAEINDVQLEWEDRFGAVPQPAKQLIACHRLRLLATAAEVVRLRVTSANEARVEFIAQPTCVNKLMEKIAAQKCRPSPDGKTVIIQNLASEPLHCAEQLADFLRDLAA